MTINDAIRALVAELLADDVPDPLARPLTLALVWADLARHAGEPTPPDVAALLDTPVPLRPARRISRCRGVSRQSVDGSR